MNEQDVFILADRTLQGVVDQVTDDQWSMTMPSDFQTTADEPVTLRQVVNHHAYDDAWVPDMLAGRTMAEVGEDAYRGDLLGADPRAAFDALVDRACAAAAMLDDPQRPVHCSYGTFPAGEFLTHVTSFRGLRAYDIAAAISASTTLPPDLVSGLWDQIEPNVEQWRAMGVFGPAVEVPADASAQDKLLAMTGRRPPG